MQNGKQMIWMSNRNGLKSYATSGSTEYDVYTMFFTQEGWDEYNLSEEQYKLKKAIEEAQSEQETVEENGVVKGNKDKKSRTVAYSKSDPIEPLSIDLDNIEDRIAKLTIHSSRMSDAVLSKDGGTMYYLTRFDGGYDLWSTNLRSRETKVAISLNGSSGKLMWDKEQEQLYLLCLLYTSPSPRD